MDIAADLARGALRALGMLAAQPFYYIGIIFVLLQYHRQIALERRLFGTRLHSLADTAWRTVLWGLLAGLAGTVVMAFVGATVPAGAVVWLWAISALLTIVRVRFVCLAYSVGILGLFKTAVDVFPELASLDFVGPALKPLADLPVSSMLALVGILHLLESFCVYRQGADMAMPVFVEGKRGKPIGGYQLQQFWPVPLLLLVPAASAGAPSAPLPWTPLFGGDAAATGWTFAAMPVMLGFAAFTASRLPRDKAVRSARLLAVYAAAVLGFAALAEWVPASAPIGSLAAIALHEAAVWWSRREEEAKPPLFVHGNDGLKILGVLPRSPAHEMGLMPGEIIRKANGVQVRTKEELHEALRLNAAFCKLEIVNTEGHIKFAQRALFAGEHHLLGVLLAPDDRTLHVLERRNLHWFTKAGSRQNAPVPGRDEGAGSGI